MKTINPLAVLLLATGIGSANPVAPSDAFWVVDPDGNLFLELDYYGPYHFVVRNGMPTPAPPPGELMFTGIAGDPGMASSPMFLLDSEGSLRELFGVFPNPLSGAPEVAFIPNAGPSPLPISPPPGATLIAGPYFTALPVTQYLDAGLQQQGYTAQFKSGANIPDAARTCWLLWLGIASLAALRLPCFSLNGKRGARDVIRDP